jgi:hypothetical protein
MTAKMFTACATQRNCPYWDPRKAGGKRTLLEDTVITRSGSAILTLPPSSFFYFLRVRLLGSNLALVYLSHSKRVLRTVQSGHFQLPCATRSLNSADSGNRCLYWTLRRMSSDYTYDEQVSITHNMGKNRSADLFFRANSSPSSSSPWPDWSPSLSPITSYDPAKVSLDKR